MKITQETNEFKPITIVLETREDKQRLLDIIVLARSAAMEKNLPYTVHEFIEFEMRVKGEKREG